MLNANCFSETVGASYTRVSGVNAYFGLAELLVSRSPQGTSPPIRKREVAHREFLNASGELERHTNKNWKG
jgi:hypothetical protein